MTPELWARFIPAAAVPVVLISACALLCLAFYNRLVSSISRLRVFQRERLQMLEKIARESAADRGAEALKALHERTVASLEEQTRRVIARAQLLRSALTFTLSAVVCLIVCSVVSGLSVLWEPAAYLAAVLFLAGVALLLAGVLCAIKEVRAVLESVELETQFVTELEHEWEKRAGAGPGIGAPKGALEAADARHKD
ncbi:MAG: DUF2721 domain-containing protein [Planctomycetes bacterium]|nr:DUF2721 domain-containing protein [Planctomycetota bacterium]